MTETIYVLILTFMATQGDMVATTNMTIEGYTTLSACQADADRLEATLTDPTVIYYGAVCSPEERDVDAEVL